MLEGGNIMNSAIKSVIEKVCSDERLFKEFAKLQGTKFLIFWQAIQTGLLRSRSLKITLLRCS